LRLVLYINCA